MARPVKIGLVGLGQRGLQHLDALTRLPEAEVVALCDPFPANLEEAKIQRYASGFRLGATRICARFDELLQTPGLEAVYLAIPPGRHDGELLTAARAGLHIFAEKPVSLYLDEAAEMERAVQQAGVVATVGFQLRHDAWHEVVRAFLRDKRLVMATSVGHGALESHSVKHTPTEALGGPQNRVWAANMAWSGSTVVESGIHQLDLWRYWAGDVEWTRANYAHRSADDVEEGGDNPYAYAVTFGFASGMIGTLLLSRLRRTYYGDGYQDLAWDHGHLKLEAQGPVAYYYDGPYPPPGQVDPASLRHALEAPPRGDSTLAINQAFVQAVATRSHAPLRNTFASSMNSLAAVLAANVSDQLGGERVVLSEFAQAPSYASHRARPA